MKFNYKFIIFALGLLLAGNLLAGTASITGSWGGASGTATGTIGVPYLSGSTYSANYSYNLSVGGTYYTTALVVIGYKNASGVWTEFTYHACDANTAGHAKTGSGTMTGVPVDAQSVGIRAYVQTSSSGGVDNWSYETMPLLTQTVTLSPNGGAAAIVKGQTFSGTATGAQAGNPYNISIVSGQGSAAINSATGAYTVTANGAGLITYKVWVSAGGGYERSQDAQASIAVAESQKVKVTIPANNGKYPITYKLYQGGGEIGSYTQMPGGSAYILTIDVGANDGQVTMKAFTQGIMTDGVVFVDDVSGNVEEVLPVVINPSSNPDAPSSVIPAPNTTTSTTAPPSAGGASGVVWSSTGGAGSDALTNSTYREGVGKIIDTLTGDLPQADSQEAQMNANEADSTTAARSVLDDAADVSDNVKQVREALVGKQPVLVDVSGSQYVYSYTFAQIGKTWTIDLSFIATPVNLMRTVIKVLFLLFMWFLYARTLRSAQV